MNYRLLLMGLIILILSFVLSKQLDSPKPIPTATRTVSPTQVKNPRTGSPVQPLKSNPAKSNVPAQELSHEEFVAIEQKYATEKLKALTMGWCNASEIEVAQFFIDSYSGNSNHARKEIIRPNSICLNTYNKDLECFTYQVFCPGQFQETNDVTLLQFWSGENVYRYERRVMDYKTYIENPDSPAFPPLNYWAARANEIKLLAERLRGEPMAEQNWGIKPESDGP